MELMTASTFMPAPAPRPARYVYRSVQTVSGAVVASVPLRQVRYGRVLNGVGTFSARLPLPTLAQSRAVMQDELVDEITDDLASLTTVATGRLLAAAYVDATAPLRRTIYVERDGIVVDAYTIWARDYDHDTQELTISGAQMWSLLQHRRIRWNATFTQVDQLAIVRALIDKAQESTGGNLGIAVTDNLSGRLRDRTYTAFEEKPLGEAIQELAAVIDGFDFRLDVDRSGSTYTRTLRLFYPRVGRDALSTGHVWRLGSNMLRLDWPENAQRTANSIVGLGQGEGATMLRSVVTNTSVLAEGFPLLEDSISLKDVNVQATLTGHARTELEDRAGVMVLPKAVVLADRAPTLGAYVPGDDARLVVPPNRDPRWPDGLDVFARVVEIDAQPSDDGEPETVQLTFEEIT